jgi:spore coat polysaccharide biosynthesis protein SpsF
MKDLVGAPLLARQLERVARARLLDRIEVATSEGKDDDAIAQLCESLGVGCFRGALDDVLDRYYQAARRHTPAHVVRLTADCPLADWEVIDAAVRLHLEGGYDYTSNALERTYQHGLDVEVMTFQALEIAWREADLPDEREHVTQFIYDRPERFRLGRLTRAPSLAAQRWTVDYPEDYALVSAVYEALYPGKPDFTSTDVLRFLADHPEIAALNAGRAGESNVGGARPSA